VDDFAVFVNFAGNPVLFEDEDISAAGFSGERFEVETGTTFVAVASGALSVNGYAVRVVGQFHCNGHYHVT
jgi:hypothetical protein